MLEVKAEINIDGFNKLKVRLPKATNKSLAFAGMDIKRDAERSIKVRPKNGSYSAPGQPPKTRGAYTVYRYAADGAIYQIWDKKKKAYHLFHKTGGNYEKISRKLPGPIIRRKTGQPYHLIAAKNWIVPEELVKRVGKSWFSNFRHEGKLLRNSILFQVIDNFFSRKVVIGPSYRAIGRLGQLMERGGRGPCFRNNQNKTYSARPFMAPALARMFPKIMQKYFKGLLQKAA